MLYYTFFRLCWKFSKILNPLILLPAASLIPISTFARRKICGLNTMYLYFRYNVDTNSHICTSTQVPLATLTDLLQTEFYFPWNYFKFTSVTLATEDLQEFLETHGHQLLGLCLSFFSPFEILENVTTSTTETLSGGASSFSNFGIQENPPPFVTTHRALSILLVEQAPNLKSLILENFPQQPLKTIEPSFSRLAIKTNQKDGTNFPKTEQGAEEPEKTNETFILPHQISNLKYLWFGEKVPLDVVKVLRKNAPYARPYHSPCHVFRLEEAMATGRFHWLTYLTFLPRPDNIVAYENVLYSQIKAHLKFIDVDLTNLLPKENRHLNKRVASVLRYILEANASTLTEFLTSAPFSILCGSTNEGPGQLSLQRLPRVTSMSIFYGFTYIMSYFPELNEVTRNFFPAGFQFDDTFPNLSKVVLDLKCVSAAHENCPHSWEDLFCAENTRPALTVQNLIFKKCDFVPESCMIQCTKVFPNVRDLYLRTYYNNFSYSVKHVWGFKFLEILRFFIEFPQIIPDLPQFQIDSTFTGFSQETVANLIDVEIPAPVEPEAFIGLRENVSIVDIKEIKTLQICVVDMSSILRTSYPSLFSHVSGAFGFAMCPLLTVKLSFDVRLEENTKSEFAFAFTNLQNLSYMVVTLNITDFQGLHVAMSPILPFVHLTNSRYGD